MATALDDYRPFDAGLGANTTEDQWRKFARFFVSSGVIRGEDNELAVYGDSTGLQVKARPGKVWIRGHYGESAGADKVLAVSAVAGIPGGQSRIDLVVVRADFVNNRIELDVIAGVPAASPVAPAPTQNGATWELPLATIGPLTNATATVTAGMVTAQHARIAPPSDLGDRDRCRATNNANVSCPNNVATAIGLNTESTDVGGLHSTTVNTSRATAGKAGWYRLEGGGVFAAAAGAGQRQLYLRVNGTTFVALDGSGNPGAADLVPATPSTSIELAAGDYVELVALQNSGAAVNLLTLSAYSPVLAMTWEAPAA